MPAKPPKAKRLRRAQFASDAEFIAALIAQDRVAEAEAYQMRRGVSDGSVQ